MAPWRNESTRASWPVRCVFDVLATRERERVDSLSAACLTACGKRPDTSDLRWTPIDLVPAAEIADIRDSSLSTPYTAWALAVRHRQRAFVFWTYVIALAEDPSVRLTAERLAREALSDGNLLRRERRLAWRAERKIGKEDAATTHDGIAEPASAALAGEPSAQGHGDLVARGGPGPARTTHDPRWGSPAPAFPDAERPRRRRAGRRGNRTGQAPCAAPRRAVVCHLSQ